MNNTSSSSPVAELTPTSIPMHDDGQTDCSISLPGLDCIATGANIGNEVIGDVNDQSGCALSPDGVTCFSGIMLEDDTLVLISNDNAVDDSSALPTPTPNSDGSNSAANTAPDIFRNPQEYCRRLDGEWIGEPTNKCIANINTAKAICAKVGGKWIPDSFCDVDDLNRNLSEEEWLKRLCAALGGVLAYEAIGPTCRAQKAEASNGTSPPNNSPSSNTTDVFRDLQEYCLRLDGEWLGEPTNKCIVNINTAKAFCAQVGGKWISDTSSPYCKAGEMSDEDYYKKLCAVLEGVLTYGPNGPVCTVEKSTSPENNPADSTNNGSLGDLVDCNTRPDDPACNTIAPGYQVDCNANPSACGSTTLETLDTGSGNDNSGEDNGGNTSSDGDTATIDPCVENPSDPSCNTETINPDLQVDCNADPSACGSTTIDLGGGDSSSGGGTDGIINTVDCNANPTDPSCNTIGGP